jgi:ABC-type nickel/cobalt efflux system permease component RcnA
MVQAFALGMGLTLFDAALTAWSTKQKITQIQHQIKPHANKKGAVLAPWEKISIYFMMVAKVVAVFAKLLI